MVYHDPTAEQFDELVKSGKTVVDFWASWCGPCRAQAPIVEQLAEETDVKLIKIDVDAEEELTSRFGIQSIPTLVLYSEGEIIRTIVGLTPLDELKKAFDL